MEKLTQNYDITIDWRSYELRPRNGPPISPEYRAHIEASRPRLFAIAREHYDLDLNPGPFGIDSRLSLIGAKVAEALDAGPAFHDAVFRAYWQEGLSIEDRGVLCEIAQSVGLEPDAFWRAVSSPAYEAMVDFDIQQSRAYGLTGVPALIFNRKYLVVGAQPYEALENVVQQIMQEQAQPTG